MIWQLSPGHDLRAHHWGEQCVVHHRSSNLTVRLAGWAGQLLEDLRDRGPMEDAQLQATFPGVSPEALEAALLQLADQGLLSCHA